MRRRAKNLTDFSPIRELSRGNLRLREIGHVESGSNHLRRAMTTRNAATLVLDPAHCRAICEEIGERLRAVLKPEASEIPPRLLALMDRLAQLEEAPSIVPSIDEMAFPLPRPVGVR
jgi:hypothetical protein